MTFQVFTKPYCQVCAKAEYVLRRLGIEPIVRHIDGTGATPDNLADFAWFGWTGYTPLVLALDGDSVLGRWDGKDVRGSWIPVLCRWLADHNLDHPQPLVRS